MPFFRKKPLVIEARLFAPTFVAQSAVAEWCGGSVKGMALSVEQRTIHIQTPEGEMEGKVGDWIIKGVNGEFYLCKSFIFEKTYDKV